MAKKKAPVLTPEERLKQALVLEAEQPYSIPENWCWIHLLNAFDNRTDSKKKIQQKNYLKNGTFSIVDQGQEIVGGYTNDSNMIYDGALPVIIFGDHTRCIKYIDFPFAQGADGVKVLKPYNIWDAECFYYAFQSIDIPNMGYRRHYPLFLNFSIPLPPLPEQRRIVFRIESLFAKLDEAKEKLQAVIDGHEPRRAAILHRAFTGELTARWRVNKGTSFTDWRDELLKNVTTRITAGGDKPEDFTELRDECHKIPVVANGVSNDGIIGYTSQARVTGETVTVAGRGTIGHAIFRAYPYYPVVRLIVIEVQNCLDARYLRCVFEEYPEKGTGSSIPQLTVPVVKEKRLPVPPIEEQQEIVRILDSLFAKEQQVLVAAQAALAQIDVIKKSILARAFRGELGTNDPAEESAANLIATLPREG